MQITLYKVDNIKDKLKMMVLKIKVPKIFKENKIMSLMDQQK